MPIKSLSIEELAILPEEVKRQLVDYAEFLLQKYVSEQEKLSPQLKNLLEERSSEYQTELGDLHDSQDVEDTLLEKYRNNV